MNLDLWKNTSVLVTGHTGFKGSWLSLWLSEMGANVTGLALSPHSSPNHWDLLQLNISDHRVDIRDVSSVSGMLQEVKPAIVFHLAAQPLVRRSYRDPIETWSTNVLGTTHLLESCRLTESVRAVVIVTSDKVYDNQEWLWGYRENDRLGGYDPYSASKAACELVVESYRKSFFQSGSALLLASARAGNVIGGGDWSADRLIPDLVRAVTQSTPLEIRFPQATRPWQHVLECLNGYLLLGQELLEGNRDCAEPWNFGPDPECDLTVVDILMRLKTYWPDLDWRETEESQLHEIGRLNLDNSKSKAKLGWKPVWNLEESLSATARWYRHYHTTGEHISRQQLGDYMQAVSGADVS